ncbi:MAG: amidohydrolase family protein [Woeseiaceae bacterium]
MCRYILVWILCCALSLPDAAFAQTSRRPAQPVALVGGMLLDGYESEPLHHAVVVFENGRITAVGAAHEIEIPDNAIRINVAGKTVMPGLIDAHVHVDLIGHGDYDRYYNFLGGMKRLDDAMPIAAKQMLRAGVTSAIDLGTPLEIIPFRERIRDGELPGPRLTVSGPWITRTYLAGVPDAYQIIIDSPREAARQTNVLIDAGVDVIKTWVGLTVDDYRAVVKAAHARDVKVHAHLYKPDAIRAAIDAGVDVFQHVGSAKNPPYADALINEIAHKNIPIVQTIAHRIWVYPATVEFPGRLYDPIYAADMPADFYAEFIDSFENFERLDYFRAVGREIRNSKVAARQFIDGGAYIGVGTDAASPLNTHLDAMWFELSALVESGMTPIQVLSAATKTNAEILGQFKDIGSVEVGKLADLIVVDGNPLADIDTLRRIPVVIKDGAIWHNGSNQDPALVEHGHAF